MRLTFRAEFSLEGFSYLYEHLTQLRDGRVHEKTADGRHEEEGLKRNPHCQLCRNSYMKPARFHDYT